MKMKPRSTPEELMPRPMPGSQRPWSVGEQEPLRTLHRTPQTMATALDAMLFQCGRAVNWPGTSLSMIVNAAMLLYPWLAQVRPALDS